MGVYEKPALEVIGSLHELTLGGPFSCADGNSGTAGNNSINSGECQPSNQQGF